MHLLRLRSGFLRLPIRRGRPDDHARHSLPPKERMNRFAVCPAAFALIALSVISFPADSASAQSLLVIPDLSAGADETLHPNATPRRGGVGFDLVGSMSPRVSERFWGEASSSILPGSSIGLGDASASIYTEIGQVLSGSWRIAVGTTIAIAGEETEGMDEEHSTGDADLGLNRFIAGGGSVALSGVRPIVLAKLGEYLRGGLIVAPRVWANTPTLSSARGITDYGGELAGSVLLQRHDNAEHPFLTLEVRGGVVAGSDRFYQTIGWTAGDHFAYIAPTLTAALREQVNVGVSAFFSEVTDGDPTITLGFTLLNKAQ